MGYTIAVVFGLTTFLLVVYLIVYCEKPNLKCGKRGTSSPTKVTVTPWSLDAMMPELAIQAAIEVDAFSL